MPLWRIAWKSIQHRSLASGLTAFSMALGVALVVCVLVIYGILDQSFKRSAQGYHYIVGPKGSSLELVMNVMFYSGVPSDTIPYDYYRQLAIGRYAHDVETAVPLVLDAPYRGSPVVATTPDFFTKFEYSDGKRYTFRQGKCFTASGTFEAVLGYTAAHKTGLNIGDTFQLAHGKDTDKLPKFTVVGVMNATSTPNDRAIFVNLEGYFSLHESIEQSALDRVLGTRHRQERGVGDATESAPETEHVHTADCDHSVDSNSADSATEVGHVHTADCNHSAERRLSAILVLTRQRATTATVNVDQHGMETGVSLDSQLNREVFDIATMALPERINRDLDAMAVSPARQVARLFEDIIGNVQLVLIILAVLVVIVAGIGMMVSIYNSMNERRQEIAIMRALGARRVTVMAIILLESILLSLGGGAFGVVIGHGLIAVLGPWISEAVNIVVDPFSFQWIECALVPGLIILASAVGYLPAVIAYRTDVAQSL
ncbi:MAG: ABC transporter permease [Thermoguttaceae bacterium]